MTEFELLQERVSTMAKNAVNTADAIQALTQLLQELHDKQTAINEKLCIMGEKTILIAEELEKRIEAVELEARIHTHV